MTLNQSILRGELDDKFGDRADMKMNTRGLIRAAICGMGMAVAISSTGCQVSVGGQLLPSPYYLDDDVQYFAPGSEFPLPREAAAQRMYAAEQQVRNGN